METKKSLNRLSHQDLTLLWKVVGVKAVWTYMATSLLRIKLPWPQCLPSQVKNLVKRAKSPSLTAQQSILDPSYKQGYQTREREIQRSNWRQLRRLSTRLHRFRKWRTPKINKAVNKTSSTSKKWQLLLIEWTMTSKPFHLLASSKMCRAKSLETAQCTQTQSCQMPTLMFKARNTSCTATKQSPRSSALKRKTKKIDLRRSLATKAHKAYKHQSTQSIWKWWQVQVLKTTMRTFRMLGCTERRYSYKTWSWWLTSIPSPSCFKCSRNQA